MKAYDKIMGVWNNPVVVVLFRFFPFYITYLLMASEYGVPVLESLIGRGANPLEQFVFMIGLWVPLAELTFYQMSALNGDNDNE